MEFVANLGKRLGSLDDLPQEVLDCLRLNSGVSRLIVEALNALDGVATIDEIIVSVWRKDGIVRKRNAFYTTLKNMAKDETIKSMGHRTGVYALPSFREKPVKKSGHVYETTICKSCGKSFEARKSELARGKAKFCSRECVK